MLTLQSVSAGYGESLVLRNIDFTVGNGEVVALLGPNGAGKSTLLRTASGFVKPVSGQVMLEGQSVTGDAPHLFARQGICLLPEGRGIFPSLTVLENLRIQVGPVLMQRRSPKSASSFRVFAISYEGPPEAFPAANSRWSPFRGPS